jgi:regulator of sirC expression with transglutaminase-like and TPR domain
MAWRAEPLAFPAQVLLRLTGQEGERLIFDPFAGGQPLGPADLRIMLKTSAGASAELDPAHYAGQSNRDLLLRLQTGVKLRYLRHAELRRALETVEAMLLFAPDQIGLWREAGLMHLRQGNIRASITALEQFVARSPNSPARHRTCVLIQDLRQRLS